MSDKSKAGPHLHVDPIACDGIGICSHMVSELITVDSWGYPIVTKRALTAREVKRAKAAIAACPRQALYLTESSD
jgi:ferredoxin